MTALAIVTPIDRRRPEQAAHAADRAVALYEGVAIHRRHGPNRSGCSRPSCSSPYLDVDALPESLDAFPVWSARRPAPVHFRPATSSTVATAARRRVSATSSRQRLGRRPTGPVTLLAHLRTFGWLFNPLAVYYCWSPDR